VEAATREPEPDHYNPHPFRTLRPASCFVHLLVYLTSRGTPSRTEGLHDSALWRAKEGHNHIFVGGMIDCDNEDFMREWWKLIDVERVQGGPSWPPVRPHRTDECG
jgi:hypothetical protein